MDRQFEPRDPDFEERVRTSFDRQAAMGELEATMRSVEPGRVAIMFPFQERFTQQHGFLHAGMVAAVLDSACGYAALSLTPPGAGVLSIEFKVNLLAPASGEYFLARGRVLRPGRTITVCQGTVTAFQRGDEVEVAAMQASIMTMRGRAGIAD